MDLWKFAYIKPRVNITDTQGNEYTGDVIDVLDDETTGYGEDCVEIDLPGGDIKIFLYSEIASIREV